MAQHDEHDHDHADLDHDVGSSEGEEQGAASRPLAPVRLKGLHIAPRKVRVVVDRIRGKPVEEALNLLQFIPKAGAEPVRKLLYSAMINAEAVKQLAVDDLYVEAVFVDQGEMMKRWTPRAQGRATRILKKTSHVTIQLGIK